MKHFLKNRSRWRVFLVLYFIVLSASFTVTTLFPEFSFRPTFSRNRMKRDYPLPGLAAVESGKGPVLLLLHGSPGSADNFEKMIPHLEKNFHVIAPDLPGFAGSAIPENGYSLPQMANTMFRLMDAYGVQKFHILGYSYGSGVALTMADLAPERVESLILYGGIGIQEGEGSGSYLFEHIKYLAGFPPILLLPELIPHFGLLGPRKDRYSFIMSFWDIDQRPLRRILETLNQPVLILHGVKDPLVPAKTAREHHALLPNSRLIMNENRHFMPFTREGARQLSEETRSFIHYLQNVSSNVSLESRDIPDPLTRLPTSLDPAHLKEPWLAFLVIAAATFVSEDLTIVSAGLLTGAGRLDFFFGTLACFSGIFIGDIGLWLLGILIRRIPFLKSFFMTGKLESFESWFQQHGGKAVFASRFIPGTRFITFTGAGLAGLSLSRMSLWAFLAGGIWAPVLVLLSAWFGTGFVNLFVRTMGEGWIALILGSIFTLIMIRFLVTILSPEGRRKTFVTLLKIPRYEFWPPYIYYIPTFFYILYMDIRYRSLTLYTIANPGIPFSGIVGESKAQILDNLLESWVIPYKLLYPVESGARVKNFDRWMDESGWSYPVILKPDASQRGAGIKLVRTREEAEIYFNKSNYPVIVQKYHPGPYELGVFFYRFPEEEKGHIFSITDKVFPEIIGDGVSTIETLIRTHPRYRFQEQIFLNRHQSRLNEILPAGSSFQLGRTGNHCQGALFKDGAGLITPELENTINNIVAPFEGFYIGRFDIRFQDPQQLKQGKGFQVVELNGATSESTNVYDPDMNILQTYSIQFRQIRLLFKISDQVRKKGQKPIGVFKLIKVVFGYYWKRDIRTLSD